MMEKLWGDNFFDPETKKWRKQNTSESGKPIRRAFSEFIMEPIRMLAKEVMDRNEERYKHLVSRL